MIDILATIGIGALWLGGLVFLSFMVTLYFPRNK